MSTEADPNGRSAQTPNTDSTPAPGANEMYPIETALRQPFEERGQAVQDVLGLSLEQRRTRERDFAGEIRATGLDPHAVGGLLYGAMTDAEIAEARGADPVEAADIQAMNEETRRALRETYGQRDTEELLARADKFVKQHPKLAAILRTRHIGSRTDIVQALVEHVRRVNFR